jgi:hypothetical protein
VTALLEFWRRLLGKFTEQEPLRKRRKIHERKPIFFHHVRHGFAGPYELVVGYIPPGPFTFGFRVRRSLSKDG